MKNNKVLIVDDDRNICNVIKLFLQKEGFDTVLSYDGKDAFLKFEDEFPDLVLLDIMLPYYDGWEVLKKIRKTSDTPVIMLTAKGETIDKVLGLELGADDYVVKPFDGKELVARVKAVLRRYKSNEDFDKELVFKNLIINISTYVIKHNGKEMEIPPKEIELLYFLASNPNKVFTREQLLDKVWGFEYFGDSRTVDVHVKRLREKLDSTDTNWELKTVWGVGYKFEVK